MAATLMPGDAITATATDPAGNTSEFSHWISVVFNSAPTANAGGAVLDLRGKSLALSAAGSSDPDSDSLTYSWT